MIGGPGELYINWLGREGNSGTFSISRWEFPNQDSLIRDALLQTWLFTYWEVWTSPSGILSPCHL